jgi:hypothetical protein
MNSSREDAVALFSKWKSEATPLIGIFSSAGVGFRFGGFIVDFTPEQILVGHFSAAYEFSVRLDLATGFDYQDTREAPDELRESSLAQYVCCLTVLLPEDNHCRFYEVLKENT